MNLLLKHTFKRIIAPYNRIGGHEQQNPQPVIPLDRLVFPPSKSALTYLICHIALGVNFKLKLAKEPISSPHG